jgi:hypothetical protein
MLVGRVSKSYLPSAESPIRGLISYSYTQNRWERIERLVCTRRVGNPRKSPVKTHAETHANVTSSLFGYVRKPCVKRIGEPKKEKSKRHKTAQIQLSINPRSLK